MLFNQYKKNQKIEMAEDYCEKEGLKFISGDSAPESHKNEEAIPEPKYDVRDENGFFDKKKAEKKLMNDLVNDIKS